MIPSSKLVFPGVTQHDFFCFLKLFDKKEILRKSVAHYISEKTQFDKKVHKLFVPLFFFQIKGLINLKEEHNEST